MKRRRRSFKVYSPKGPNLPTSNCPHCGKECDATSGIGAHADTAAKKPETSYLVCIDCGNVNGLDDKLQLRKLDEQELAMVMFDPDAGLKIRATQITIRQIKAKQALDGKIQP
jgi:transcription elongation factor Elf1